MLFVRDDTQETYIFILAYVKFMGIDLVTEESSATVKCAVPCRMWETTSAKRGKLHGEVETACLCGHLLCYTQSWNR